MQRSVFIVIFQVVVTYIMNSFDNVQLSIIGLHAMLL